MAATCYCDGLEVPPKAFLFLKYLPTLYMHVLPVWPGFWDEFVRKHNSVSQLPWSALYHHLRLHFNIYFWSGLTYSSVTGHTRHIACGFAPSFQCALLQIQSNDNSTVCLYDLASTAVSKHKKCMVYYNMKSFLRGELTNTFVHFCSVT